MGLLSILKSLKKKEREIRLLVLGLDNAGKTTVSASAVRLSWQRPALSDKM
jgi:GTPase SAR1 family protein